MGSEINKEEIPIDWFKDKVKEVHVHGKKILTKINKMWAKLEGGQKKALKEVVIPGYKEWWQKNENELQGYSGDIIKERVKALSAYKKKIEKVKFSSQSKFHSSVIEEFLYYLFRDLIDNLNLNSGNQNQHKTKIILGGARAYTNLYFAPRNLSSFLKKPNMKINIKDQDFAIYREIRIKADGESETINVPVVSVECKTYIDKTMLEGSIATAEKIKNGNPYCLFLIVTELYNVSYDVDPAYSRIDQIYVLRKQKGRKTKHRNPIDCGVILDLFDFVKNHLGREWSNINKKLTKEGKII